MSLIGEDEAYNSVSHVEAMLRAFRDALRTATEVGDEELAQWINDKISQLLSLFTPVLRNIETLRKKIEAKSVHLPRKRGLRLGVPPSSFAGAVTV